MESEGGSQEPQDEELHPLEERALRRTEMRERIRAMVERDRALHLGPQPGDLTAEEAGAIADGEPYCFRCGKPASSFSEYASNLEERQSFAEYVRDEEGTYNPETNRFACDGCYIDIGMPSAPGGWRAP